MQPHIFPEETFFRNFRCYLSDWKSMCTWHTKETQGTRQENETNEKMHTRRTKPPRSAKYDYLVNILVF